MTVTLDPGQVAAAVVLFAGLLGAVGYLWRQGRKAVRVLHAVHELVNRELTPDHGHSVKDRVDQTAHQTTQLDAIQVGLGGLSQLVDNINSRLAEVDDRLTEHLRRNP